MRVLFIHPPWVGKGFGMRSQNRWPRRRGDKSARYPILLCYAATLLQENGYDVRYIDSVMQDFNITESFKKVERINPDVVFMETTTPSINDDILFANKLRETLPEVKILLAGTHATYFPEQTLIDSKADVIIKGEYDYTTLNTIKAFEKGEPLKNVKGISYIDKIPHHNARAPLVENLDALPFPDRDLIPHQWYVEGHAKKLPFTFMMTARGCPNHCTFCLWPNLYYNHTVRYRSIENVVDEIEWLIERYGMKEIFFDDGTFNTNINRVIKLSKEIISRDIDIIWSCSCRVDKVNREMLEWMKKSGCKLICYGPESASQETLNRTKKRITIEQTKNAFKLTKEAGIIIHGNFMLGFPWESREDMENTINLALESKPDTTQFSLVFPHPGTEMYEEAIENNWFYDNVVNNWDMFEMSKGPVLKSKIPKKELSKAIARAHSKFYFRPSYIAKVLSEIKNTEDLTRVWREMLSVVKGKILFNR